MANQLSLIVAETSHTLADALTSGRESARTDICWVIHEGQRAFALLRAKHIDPVQHSVCRSMQTAPNPRLDRLLVHYLEHAQDLINIFRLRLHPLMISDGIRALEMIRQLGLLELLVLSLLVHLARNRLIPHILLYIVLLIHELDEVRGVHIRFQLLEHLLQLGVVFIFSLILINAHLSLHLIVIIRHEIAHFVHDLILLLGFDRLLVVLKLASE